MIRVLALGDSYTIGESVAPAERWPVQLAAMLTICGYEVADPTIIAQTGWTTDELAHAIEEWERRDPHASLGTGGGTAGRSLERYDLVTLLIGVNNQYRGRSAEEYRREFRGLLRRAIGFTRGRPGRVIVVSIPDWGVTPFAAGRDRAQIAEDIDRFNQVNREEAASAGARYVDITAISRRGAGEPGLQAADGLHPSAAQYREWSRLILSQALAALR